MSSHNTSNQETRSFLKKCKLCDSSHRRRKRSAYGKVCYVYNKKNYFKVYSQRVGKIVYEIERDEPDDRFYQSDYKLLKLLLLRTPYILTKSRMKTLIG